MCSFRNNLLPFLVTLLFFAPITFLNAQENSPREFFPRDFMTRDTFRAPDPAGFPSPNPLAQGETTEEDSLNDTLNNEKSGSRASARGNLDSGPLAAFGRSDLKDSNIAAISTTQHGERILSLGLIVNGTDSDHAKDSIEELIETAKTFSIALSTIYAVGGLSKATEKLPAVEYIWAKTEGAKIKIARTIPKEYPVELSPSWIVETEQGLVLLDGLASIGTVINSQGKFEIAPGIPHAVEVKPSIPQSPRPQRISATY